MDGQEYLNQISATVRPEKKSKMSFMKSPIFKVVAIGMGAVLAIIIVSSIITGGQRGAKDQGIALKLHIDNTLSVISDYQGDVKSSNLRSSSASLYSVLSNTSRELTEFLTSEYDFNAKSVDAGLTTEADTERDGLTADLFQAKINGILDRVYANKMAYEIYLIRNAESKLYNSTASDTLKSLLATSYNSLENLYNDFSEY